MGSFGGNSVFAEFQSLLESDPRTSHRWAWRLVRQYHG